MNKSKSTRTGLNITRWNVPLNKKHTPNIGQDAAVKSNQAGKLPAGADELQQSPPAITPGLPTDPGARSQRMIEWLAAHPLIKVAALCMLVDTDRSNFDKMRKAGSIPDKLLDKLEMVLFFYGYQKSSI